MPRKWDWLHFLPAILQLLLILDYCILPFDDKVEQLSSLYANPELVKTMKFNMFLPHAVNHAIRIGSLLVYISLNLNMLLFAGAKFKEKGDFSLGRLSRFKKWLFLLHGLIIMMVLCYAFFMYLFNQDPNIIHHQGTTMVLGLSATAMFLINVLFFVFPEVTYGVPHFRKIHIPIKNIPVKIAKKNKMKIYITPKTKMSILKN